MKKSIFLMAGLIGFALTSCDDTSDLGVMQKNEAPVIVPADGVALQSRYNPTGNSINLQNFQETVNIPLVNIQLSNKFTESAYVTGEVEVASNADFEGAKSFALTSTAADSGSLASAVEGESRALVGYVEVTPWEDAFVSFYGQDPNPKVNYVRYKLRLTEGDQNVILYNNNGQEWFDPMEFTVTPFDLKLDVAAAYNLNYTVNGVTNTLAMARNSEKHQYDDPVYNIMVEVSEADALAGYRWTIAPADNASRQFGVYNVDSLSQQKGMLRELELGGVAGEIPEPGTYKIEANMLTKTFSVMPAPDNFYVMTLSNNPKIDFSNAAQLTTEDHTIYTGMVGLLGAWGLTGQAAYKPTVFINDESQAPTTNGATTKGYLLYSAVNITTSNGVKVPSGNGMYYLTVNLQNLTYELYRCNTFGITGSMEAQNWGAGKDIDLKASRQTFYLTWTGDVTLKAGDEWKVRANEDWAVDFGGVESGDFATDGTTKTLLAKGGKNFVATEDGTYTVTVVLHRTVGEDGEVTPYYMTVAKKN